ncbi:MAG: acyl-CoA dehydrogenase family protein [Bdellovibrionota bacterium]
MDNYQNELLQQLKKFRIQKIEPTILEDEEKGYFRPEIFCELGQLGFTGMVLPERYGGAELSFYDYCLALTELAKSSIAYAVTISVSTMVQTLINIYGTEEQKKKFLPPLCKGEEIAAFGLSESSAGSDAAALKTSAQKVAGGWKLNGNKLWISSAGMAKTYLVMARTGEAGPKGITAFIVRDGVTGFSYGKNEKKMGVKVSPTRELIFQNCFVPDDQVLGEVGRGFNLAMEALNRGRITVGALAIGLSERAFEEALKYSLDRHQFGKPIFEFQGLQFMLADMRTELEAARLLVREAAHQFDLKKQNILLASMAKLKSTDTAMQITTDAVQILGGVGYTMEYPVERLMRDAKALQIVEGTNQIQRVVIAKQLGKETQL